MQVPCILSSSVDKIRKFFYYLFREFHAAVYDRGISGVDDVAEMADVVKHAERYIGLTCGKLFPQPDIIVKQLTVISAVDYQSAYAGGGNALGSIQIIVGRPIGVA